MNNHTSRCMNDGILWTDVFLHFVLLGSLPTAFHLFLPFLVHFYPPYISIQRSLIAVLELFTNRDLILLCHVAGVQPVKTHLPSLSPQQYCLSPPSHPGIAFFHSCRAPTTHPDIRQTPKHPLSHPTPLNQTSNPPTVPSVSSAAGTLGTKGALLTF